MSEISEQEIKRRLMAVPPEALGVETLVLALVNPDAGYVCWESYPPAGVPHHIHRLSFVEAIHTALAFCRTDTRDEWCVVGAVAFILMRSLPDFQQVEPILCHPLVYVGRLKTTVIYVEATGERLINGSDFVAGVRDRAARGRILNSNISMNERQPNQAE